MSRAAAISAAAALGRGHGRVVLHSGAAADVGARHSYVASQPRRELWARGGRVVVREAGRVTSDGPGDFFEALAREVGDGAPDGRVALGFLGYDLAGGPRSVSTSALPDAWFGVYGAVLRFDHERGTADIVGDDADARQRLVRALASPARPGQSLRVGALAAPPGVDAAYRHGFARIQEYLLAGDVYQVNLSRRLVAPLSCPGDPLALLAELGDAAPVPYAALIETEWGAVVSASPERFLWRAAGSARLETRPIKGTRPRLDDDDRAAAELRDDPKEGAEHLMIVDLERNDLGRIARIGSVRVDDYARVVALPTVLHMISTVSCEVDDDVGVDDILRATFPGGSITGAPKRRAMEVIAECEPSQRGVYTGAIGYLGADGSLDLSIAIRTAVLGDDALSLHVGGAVVADSLLERELAETEHKAAAWRRVLTPFTLPSAGAAAR